MTRPRLIVVSGPPGAGKTTLAHLLAPRIGCPAICRDEIRAGMAGDPGECPSEDLNLRTLPVFFEVLRVLLAAGVTTLAEAAFQDHVWAPRLLPLADLADIRVVQCHVPPGERIRRRGKDSAFQRLRPGGPELHVDTTDGYRPALEEIVSFAVI